MKNWRYIVLLLFFASIPLFPQEGGTEANAVGIDELLVVSGLQPMVESTAELVSAGMKKYSSRLTDAASEKYDKTVDNSYEKGKIFSVFRKSFTEKIKKQDIPDIVEWLSSPLGKKITDIERKTLTPEVASGFEDFIPKSLSLNENRKNLVREFLKETSAEEMSVKIACEPLRTMMKSLQNSLPEDMKTGKRKFMDDMDVLEKEALLHYRSFLPVSVAFTYQDLTDEEFSQMLDFHGTSAGRNFNSAVLESLVDSLNSAGRECGKGMAELLVEARNRAGETAAEKRIGEPEKRRNGEKNSPPPKLNPEFVVTYPEAVKKFLFTHDSGKFMCVGLGSIEFFDVQTGKTLHDFKINEAINSITISENGSLLAAGINTGQVCLWDLKLKKLLKRIKATKWRIDAVAISPDATMLAACAEGGTVQVWDINSAELKTVLGDKDDERIGGSLAFSADGSLLAALSRDMCYLYKIQKGELIGKIAGDGFWDGQEQVSFCPDSNTVAIVLPFKIIFWDPLNNSPPRIVGLPETIDPLKKKMPMGGGPIPMPFNALSRDCRTVATVLENGDIAVWNVETRSIDHILTGDGLNGPFGSGAKAITFSPNGKLFGRGNQNGKIQIWRLEK
ncbi:MAG: hypothetical protein WAX69_19610 [Victivallales bacterium]